MEIFSPYEIEIKTSRSVEEMLVRLESKGIVRGNQFRIDTQPYTIVPRTYVKGEVITRGELTVVSFSIHASNILLFFFYMAMGFLGIFLIYTLIKAMKGQGDYSEIKLIFIFGLAAFFLMQLSFRTDADIQEQRIRNLIRE
jgi:predicted membrane channel-forming protein YqfA (hemolysin III family)